MAIQCPSCGKENKDDARACAFCPETFEFEDDPDRPKQKFRDFDPASWPVTIWIGILAIAAFGGWKVLMFVMDMGEEGAKNPINQMVSYRTTVPNLDPTKIPGTGHPSQAKVEMKFHGSLAPDNPNDWHMKGTVRDLVTLAPVADAKLVFNARGARAETTTDDAGNYSLAAAPLEHGGFSVTVEKDGYAKNYLNPAVENVPKMREDDRRALAQDLAQADDGAYEVQPYSSTPLVTDFFLAPKK